MSYFVVTGTQKALRTVGKGSLDTAKEAKARAEKYLTKHPGAPVMVMTIRRVRVWNRPKRGSRK